MHIFLVQQEEYPWKISVREEVSNKKVELQINVLWTKYVNFKTSTNILHDNLIKDSLKELHQKSIVTPIVTWFVWYNLHDSTSLTM